MDKSLLLGIDAGTSVIKAVLFDRQGRVVARAGTDNHYRCSEDGGAEQDMKRTWQAVADTVQQLHPQVADLSQRLQAMAVTGQGDGCWLIDGDGAPVGDALLWLDVRAGAMTESLIQQQGYYQHCYAHTGTGLNPCQQGPQLRWLAATQPQRLKQAATAFHCKDWIYFQCTGVRASDPSEVSISFGDFRHAGYSEAVLDHLQLQDYRHLLPPVLDGCQRHHALTRAAAKALALPAGLPVFLGYLDVVSSALGSGLYDPQQRPGCSILGSTGIHMKLLSGPADVQLNAEAVGYTLPFPVADMRVQMMSNMAATLNIDWWLQVGNSLLQALHQNCSRQELLRLCDDRLLALPPTRQLYLPHIARSGERGPYLETAARAQFSFLQQDCDYFVLLRAIYEGIAMAARDCYLAIGALPEEVRIAGGAAHSRAMAEILAAVLAVPVRFLPVVEPGAMGVAMMAAVGSGWYRDMAACSQHWLAPAHAEAVLYTPREDWVLHYQKRFPIYRRLWSTMRPLWRAAAGSLG